MIQISGTCSFLAVPLYAGFTVLIKNSSEKYATDHTFGKRFSKDWLNFPGANNKILNNYQAHSFPFSLSQCYVTADIRFTALTLI
jgi:hypothetical protein